MKASGASKTKSSHPSVIDPGAQSAEVRGVTVRVWVPPFWKRACQPV